MGLFEDLGERVERFKQQAVDASKEQAGYVCLECGEPVYTDQEECPHCGSEEVAERVQETEAGSDSTSDNTSTESDSTGSRATEAAQDNSESGSSETSNANSDEHD